MRFFALILVVLGQVLASSVLANDGVDTRQLALVDENHAALTIDGVDYVLDSYIVPFQRPYYVHVVRADDKPIKKSTAIEVAREYIKPRGCTDPLERRPKLDQKAPDKTEWLIGIAC